MVGGGGRRDDGPLKISSTNVFAALETLKKKKKLDKELKSKASKSQAKEQEPQVFWSPAPLTSKSWADVGDDEDDDYYATAALPQTVWGVPEQKQNREAEATVEESESEDDGLDIGDDDIEEETEHESEVVATEPVAEKSALVSQPAKDTERQLSKKDLKKKEMAELDALLNELGISNTDSNAAQDETDDKKQLEQTGNGDKDNAVAPPESKGSKKKKAKKEKSLKAKEEQEQQLNDLNSNKSPCEAVAEPEDVDASAVDVKERMKKVASMKKKKSSKEMDAAAKAAAVEAAARSAKLSAAKKKENKSHYNQQPVR